MSKRFDDLAMSLAADGTVGRRSMMRGALAALGLGAGAVVAGAKPAVAAPGGKPVNCPPGLTACGGQCRDLTSNVEHCGACGTVCGLDAVCRNGTCVKVSCTCEPTCNTGLTWCGACVNTATDTANCGSCGNPCPSGQVCSNGTCAAPPQCVNDAGCPVGNECLRYTCVAGVCQPQQSPVGAICNGGAGSCSAGTCVTTTCPADQFPCGSTCCPTSPGAIVTCGSDGSCIYTCLEGWTDCGGGFCDTDLSNDENNCGGCGTTCPAGSTCAGGECTCVRATCQSLGKNCGTHSDGCGGSISCGTCPTGQTCTSEGVCAVICPSGQIMCDGVCVSSSSTANCGGCGNICPAEPNSTPVCNGGTCGYTCNTGFADCNPSVAGCETNVTSSVTNCGGCNVVCPTPANGIPVCSNGQCGIRCNTGYQASGNQCVPIP